MDSAASLTLLQNEKLGSIAAIQEPTKTLHIPNNAKMNTTTTLRLLLHALPEGARAAHVLPGLCNNLLSTAVLCDAGCQVEFSKDSCLVHYKDRVVLQG